MDMRVILMSGVFCLQLCACASSAQTDQNALADAAVRNFFESAACAQNHYAYEARHPHACTAEAKQQQDKLAYSGGWGLW